MAGIDDAGGAWTDGVILRESWRWTHVPRNGVLVEDDRCTLVLLPEGRGASRVWRSRAANGKQAEALVEDVLARVKDAGGGRLIWHTGNPMAPPCMEALLVERGFEIAEELEVLAFEMGGAPEPALPRLGDTSGIDVRLAREAEDLRRALRVQSEVFSSPAPTEQDLSEFTEGLDRLERRARSRALAADGPVAFVTSASIGGRVVASAGAQVVGETLRLWGAGTLEPYRGQGAYRALVLERCRIAHTLHATLALTKANPATSAPILKAAGFRPVSRERRLFIDLPQSAP